MENKFYRNYMRKNSRGLSAVIAVVLLILLVMVTVGIVWTMVNNLVKNKTEGAKSCFDVSFSEKVGFNGDYTCYNSTSVNVGDVDLESVIVSISGSWGSKSYNLNGTASNISGLYNYPSRSTSISMPGKNSGYTYIATDIPGQPDWIKIAPVVNGKQCEVADTINSPEDCSIFVS